MKQAKTAKKSTKTSKTKVVAKKHSPMLPQEAVKSKHAGGRPPKYKTPNELQERIDAYFNSCWVDKVTEVTDKEGKCTMSTVRYQDRPYTVAGLALGLGFNSRTSLLDYDAKPEFLNIIKKAKLQIETCWEEGLAGKSPTGNIFWLKNHAGYKSEVVDQKVDITHYGGITFFPPMPKTMEEYEKLVSAGKV